MPQGTGTYGSKKGRPPKKKKGIMSSLKARRTKRASENKWTLGEKLTKAGRKRATARKTTKRLKKVGVEVSPSMAKKSGKVRRGVKGAEVTKGGAYAKYEKKSRAAKSFRSTFKAKCANGAETFTWDGRSYSCAKKGSPKKDVPKKTAASKSKEKVAYPSAKEVAKIHPAPKKK